MDDTEISAEQTMTDAEFRSLIEIPLDAALSELYNEVKRARASEKQLLAEKMGKSGSPDSYGVYWCKIADYGNSRYGVFHFRKGGWSSVSSGDFGVIGFVEKHWRLPGETYEPKTGSC